MVFSYDNKTLLKDGKPWMPTMGEMQYSRTAPEHWEENLYKMKAGGIDIVSSYVFWNHHEEIENRFDFRGCRNLRHFLRLVEKSGLYMFLRIGPWVHGEARNGGFPDWLYTKDYRVHTTDEEFLEVVERYFKQLYRQCEGYLYKNGGPIIAIQIDNEYGHAGGQGGEEGERYMYVIKDMLKRIGFDVPLYTATGWGGAKVGDCVPVWGGYCDAPWEPGIGPVALMPSYVFRANMNDGTIASDYGNKSHIFSSVEGKYPYLTAEMGGGIHATQNRRPIATARDLGAISTVKLGSGANQLGYYIYIGGKQPQGHLTNLSEMRSIIKYSGCASNMPVYDYDFQAPVSNCLKIKESYKELKKTGLFCRDFGEEFTAMGTYLPKDGNDDPYNTSNLRYSIRQNGTYGYLFINNYQRLRKMDDFYFENFTFETPHGEVSFKNLDVKNGDYYFYPFNMPVGGAVIKTAKATPLCKLNEKTYVFYSDIDPEYDIEGDLGDYKIITLSNEDALNAYKVNIKGTDYLIICPGPVMQTDKGIEFITEGAPQYKCYPDCNLGFENIGSDGIFTCYKKDVKTDELKVSYEEIEGGYKLKFEYPLNEPAGRDHIVAIDYIGDMGKLYNEYELVFDHFCNGNPWRVNLDDLGKPDELILKITPIFENNPVYIEVPVTYENGKAAKLNGVSGEILTHTTVKL